MIASTLLALLVAEASPTVDAQAIVDALTRAGGPGFPSGAHIAVQTPKPELTWALRPTLESLGASHVSEVRSSTAAVAQGAEWYLVVTRGGDELAVRVFEIDRGLWKAAPPRLTASARLQAPAASSARADASTRPSGSEPGLAPPAWGESRRLKLGPPVTLLRWKAPIWALASCPRSRGGEVLLLLESNALVAVVLNGPRARVVGRLPLPDRPAPEPVRAPFGALRCGPPGRVGVGHGRLSGGLVVNIERSPQVLESLPGWPVGHSPEGWWLAQPDQGRRRFKARIRKPDGVELSLEAPLTELAVTSRGDIFGVDNRAELRPLTPTGAFGLPLARAGSGLTAVTWQERSMLITTSPEIAREQLTLLLGAEVASQPLGAPVRTTAWGQPRGGPPSVLVVTPQGESQAVLALPVVRTP